MPMDAQWYDQIVIADCRLGKILLESGAEIYRAEQTMRFFFEAYGIHSGECSIASREITASLVDEGGAPHTFMRRASKRSLNLNKVKLINDFSRELDKKPLPIQQVLKSLDEIEKSTSYKLPLVALASGVGTGAFALVFGGGLAEMLCGFIAGFMLRILMATLNKYDFSDVFSNLLCGAVAAFLGWLSFVAGLSPHSEIITISALTLLFPGLVFTNALRDISSGDLLSGISHSTEALSIAASLAGGAAFVYTFL